jgi:hypothetical protein
MALSPAAAVRAADLLVRPVAEAFHPLAAAAAWLPPRAAAELAGRVWRDARWPRRPGLPLPEAGPVEAWFQAAFLGELRGWAARQGLDPADWERPPAATEPSHARYCPRCEAQYTAAAGECPDCGGLPLRPLTPAGPPAPPARSPAP